MKEVANMSMQKYGTVPSRNTSVNAGRPKPKPKPKKKGVRKKGA